MIGPDNVDSTAAEYTDTIDGLANQMVELADTIRNFADELMENAVDTGVDWDLVAQEMANASIHLGRAQDEVMS